MKKIKVITIVSSIDHRYLAFEWFVKAIDRSKFDIIFITINCKSVSVNSFLDDHQVKKYSIDYASGSKWNVISVWLKVFLLLFKEKPQVVHTHIFDANLLGQSAAWLLRIPKRIYTRHYSTAAHVYGAGRLKFDKLFNRLCTHVIAISKVVKKALINVEGVDERKIKLIHHGFMLNEFDNIDKARIEGLREKYGLNDESYVVGVISTFQELKGIQYIIPAFRDFHKKHPNAILMLANAKGIHYVQLSNQLESELDESSYRKIKFEDDVQALYQLFDCFVHVPVDPDIEAFGQVYIEAMISGVPMIVTRSGIADEIIVHGTNALVADYRSSESILKCLNELVENPKMAIDISNNAMDDAKKFDLEDMITKMEKLYE